MNLDGYSNGVLKEFILFYEFKCGKNRYRMAWDDMGWELEIQSTVCI